MHGICTICASIEFVIARCNNSHEVELGRAGGAHHDGAAASSGLGFSSARRLAAVSFASPYLDSKRNGEANGARVEHKIDRVPRSGARLPMKQCTPTRIIVILDNEAKQAPTRSSSDQCSTRYSLWTPPSTKRRLSMP